MWACLWWVSWFGSFSSTIKLQLLIQRAPGAWHMFLHIFCFKVNKLFLAPWLEVKLGFFFPLIEELRCPKSTLSSSIGLLVSAAKSCQTLLQPHGLPGSSVLGIFQARILEKVAIPFSRGSFRPRDWTQDSCIAGSFFFFPSEPPGKNWVSLTQDLGVVAAAVTVPLSVSNRWTWDQDHWGCPEGGSMGEVAHRKHWGIPSSIQVVTAVRCVCVGRCLAPPYHCYHPMWTTISLLLIDIHFPFNTYF